MLQGSPKLFPSAAFPANLDGSAMDFFEYALQKILFRHLKPYYEAVPSPSRRYSSAQSLLSKCSVLLSALAHVQASGTGGAPGTCCIVPLLFLYFSTCSRGVPSATPHYLEQGLDGQVRFY